MHQMFRIVLPEYVILHLLMMVNWEKKSSVHLDIYFIGKGSIMVDFQSKNTC
jgi:hypothetical protein